MKKSLITAAALVGLMSIAPQQAEARDQIRIVGSSTVFPFATTVAEQFGRSTKFKTPVIESTGSGGGLKLFCAGLGLEHPDITNASRRIKKSEVEKCAKNGITDITEVKIGYDGIVMANSNQGPRVDLTKQQIFLALAKVVPGPDGKLIDNPNMKWSDVDSKLPPTPIRVFGPPPTSGTRDAFAELAMEGGCKTFPDIKAMKKKDKKKYKAICHGVREDGAYVEAGENDNLIVQKLAADPLAFGIFGFSFLDQNSDKVHGSLIQGVEPTFENIASGDYPVSRSLYFYVKKKHVGLVPGIPEYLSEFSSEKAWGDEGYLAEKGLIPMPKEERKKYAEDAKMLNNLSM
ncbi:PstS family phosphate ABC transporter substrate-binding protein [Magnetofaba australis]|uniref:Putative phosphate binding protein n=1 Tax=Magnetofaba australis IT-1 TaxID=1434232 RepID=A0A1Y2K6V8_9PROT|nr:PstS family phosphate ABC transporter substrate-binding protein [Magnetofaba australis]OSM05283.1 putative phosphate binding protein [Magnetofaba australis IT-1]